MSPPGGESRSGRPTMVDVARLAGVSQPTVSFVLNDRRDVSVAPETRERVLAAARELKYRPNRLAQDLRLKRPTTLGVITYGIASHPYAGQTIAGIQRMARQHGFVCMVVETADEPALLDDAVTSLLDRGVAGIIYAAAATVPVPVSSHLLDARTIFVNCWPDSPLAAEAVLLPDEYGGGHAAAAVVHEQGHRAVAFLGGAEKEWATVQRRRGFLDVFAPDGAVPEEVVLRHAAYDVDSGYTLTRDLLTGSAPTALVCGNDRMALGALLALNQAGLRTPDDISLVGYDDQEDLADSIRPRLTTVRLPHYEMGMRAAELLSKPASTVASISEYFDCPLVVRDSVTRPRLHVHETRSPGALPG